MEQIFDQYFNQILRNALRYPETFQIIINNKDRQVTLIPNQKSSLLERIKSDRTLKHQLLQQLANVLEWPGTMNFFTKDGNIIVKSEITLEDLPIRDISLLANIAKDLSVREINALCIQNKEFQNACENSLFWQSLVRESFGGKYKDVVGNYNWKKVYQGLRYYYDNKDTLSAEFVFDNNSMKMVKIPSTSGEKQKHDYTFWQFIYGNYYEAFMVLIFGNTEFDNIEFQTLTKPLTYILPYQFTSQLTVDLFKHIFNNYKLTNEILNGILLAPDPEILKLVLNYQDVDSEGNLIKIDKDEVIRLYDEYINSARDLNPEVFEILHNYLDGSWSPESLLKVLSDMNYPKTDLVDFIISKLPDDPKDLDLQRWFRDIINATSDSNKREQIKVILNKYREYVKEYAVDLLISIL